MNQAILIPEYPQKLPGSIWGITVFFNPVGYKNKYRNYVRFRDSIKKQGLSILVVELAFQGKSFELSKEDAEILIQLTTEKNNVLWQKEALLNIGLKNLPQDCDKIVWLDCDVLFKNDHWVEETAQLLEQYVVVQPYDLFVRLDNNQYDIKDMSGIPFDSYKGKKWYGTAYSVVHHLSNGLLTGHPGYAFAARKEVFDDCGFFDSLILGSSDTAIVCSFYAYDENILNHFLVTAPLKWIYLKWMKVISARVNGSVFYTPGTIFHLWHGEYNDRRYFDRQLILKKYNFDPAIDIKKDEQGVWGWNSDKPQLHSAVRGYFFGRKEDGIVSSKELFLKILLIIIGYVLCSKIIFVNLSYPYAWLSLFWGGVYKFLYILD